MAGLRDEQAVLPKITMNKLQVLFNGQWMTIKQGAIGYLQGYMDAMANQSPRLAHQIVAPSGKVLDEIPERTEVSIGQVAGWPTAEQYEAAAKRALERAEAIRNQKNGLTH